MSDKTITPIEALRQVAFPGFPDYDQHCESTAHEDESTLWYCTRHPGHEGPHMATYLATVDEFSDVDVIGFAWIEEEL